MRNLVVNIIFSEVYGQEQLQSYLHYIVVK